MAVERSYSLDPETARTRMPRNASAAELGPMRRRCLHSPILALGYPPVHVEGADPEHDRGSRFRVWRPTARERRTARRCRNARLEIYHESVYSGIDAVALEQVAHGEVGEADVVVAGGQVPRRIEDPLAL